MNFLLYSLAMGAISVPLIILTTRFKKISAAVYLVSLTVSSLLALMCAVHVLADHIRIDYWLNFKMVMGEFHIGVDLLSAFFLLTITILFFLAGIYGYGYLRNYEQKNLSAHYALYLILFISLMLIVIARDAILFLMAWEMMTVSSYFLIVFYDEEETVRKAGYLNLIATHTGTFCLWIMFFLMGKQAGSMDFDQMFSTSFPLSLAGLIFVLAILGFGVKAGFIPLHIWLPHAHPAAPSHVSAVLSGVMIKMGIYGLMKVIFILKDLPPWSAVTLLFIGMISGVGGVLYALGQHEIKKLLAYHSIENIGIITLGLGIGLWGQINHVPLVMVVGYAGALLHVFNHAIFKGLLFLSAGSMIRSTHTGEIDHLGGLLKVLPFTGTLFLVGSLSICGLPLFNGFVSEWLVYRALFEGVLTFKTKGILINSLAIISLALIGGLAAACFTKAFGTIFLGNSRSVHDSHVKEYSPLLYLPMTVLGGICLWIGLFPKIMVSFALNASASISSTQIPAETQQSIISPLITVVLVLFILLTILSVLVLFKRIAMKFLPIGRSQTWGCGYSLPTSRMQYSASSFAEPILRIFRNVLGYAVVGNKSVGYFPKEEHVTSHVAEASEDLIFRPIFRFIQFISLKLKVIQFGYTQLYLLYIFIFLLILLAWKMI